MTQSYFASPKDIRLQCSYFVFYNISNEKELSEIQIDHCLDVDKDTFKTYFTEVTPEPYNFFLIDKKTREMRFRRNLDTVFGP